VSRPRTGRTEPFRNGPWLVPFGIAGIIGALLHAIKGAVLVVGGIPVAYSVWPGPHAGAFRS